MKDIFQVSLNLNGRTKPYKYKEGMKHRLIRL